MRILTVWNPWAWAIIYGGKTVENRSRNIAGDYRGPVVIHAGLGADSPTDPRWMNADLPDPLPNADRIVSPGKILGVVDLVGVHHSGVNGCGTGDAEGPISSCSPWGDPISTHLVLANPRDLAEPIPYRGALGLRHLDPETTARILEQIGKNQ